MKYILVNGGVISGIGKGVIASSVGTLLKSWGIRVTSIKVDPYINIDAGTFSPYEHGEVFVLDDGGEVDLDLGNYERFLDVTLHRDNNITTGKIYQHVINKERKGDYLGKTVQVVPHVTDAIQEWVERVAVIPVDGDCQKPEVCIVELGGTIGDIEGMPFVEAFCQFQFKLAKQDFCCVHVSLVPEPRNIGEQKSKPTQASVRELRRLGLSPDLVICRSHSKLQTAVREKISTFCHVPIDQVICVHDVTSVYRVPLLLEEQGVGSYFITKLQLNVPVPPPRKQLLKWKDLADRYDTLIKEVTIALVGKYTKLMDAYTSVVKALTHSSLAINHRLRLRYIAAADLEPCTLLEDAPRYHEAWHNLVSSSGVVVPGGFGARGTEGKILAAQWCRTKNIPFLGVCLGFQCAVVDFARNVLGWSDAHSTEFNPETSHPVVIEMPEHNTGIMGGTMRLGKRTTFFTSSDSLLKKMYLNKESVDERHRHRYEVNPSFVPQFVERGMKFVGQSGDGERMEVMELEDHLYFVGVQYHPEYISRPLKPSPPYLGLILAAAGKLHTFLNRGCTLTPTVSNSDIEESEDELNQILNDSTSNACSSSF